MRIADHIFFNSAFRIPEFSNSCLYSLSSQSDFESLIAKSSCATSTYVFGMKFHIAFYIALVQYKTTARL